LPNPDKPELTGLRKKLSLKHEINSKILRYNLP